MKNDSFIDLREINLDGNKITNLNFLDKIKSNNLKKITIKNNPINDGILYINENLLNSKIRKLDVKIENGSHVLSLYYKYNDKYELYFDYFIDIHKNLDILQQLNLEEILELNLSNIKLKKIDFLLNNSFRQLKYLNLDSNKIEDISILSNENLGILNSNKVSIKDNPIKKGLNALLNGKFFNRCVFIELSIYKKEEVFKISANFMHFNIDIDFFINNINELKIYFDFNNNYIKLDKTNNIEEAKIIEDEIKSSENNKQFEIILNTLNVRKYYNSLSIYYEEDDKQIRNFKNNKIIINEYNKISFENVFKILSNKNYNLSKLYSIYHLLLYNFDSKMKILLNIYLFII